MSGSAINPVWDGEKSLRLNPPLSLSDDHGAVDEAAGARVTTCRNGILSDFRRILL